MKNSSSIYFLSCPNSHIAYHYTPSTGVIISAAGCADSLQYNSIGVSPHTAPCAGWVVATKGDFEQRKAWALAALDLVPSGVQDALFLEICDAFDAQETAYLLA